jgi:hypothetical protein
VLANLLRKKIRTGLTAGSFAVALFLFGLFSIFGTLVGIQGTHGDIANIRDLAPMVAGLVAGPYVGLAVGLSADMKSRQKTQVKFEGMLGRVMGMFGGKAAKEGVISTVAISGDRMMTVTDQSGELVDLAAEKVYSIDFKDKSYKVKTFAEIRKEWEDAKAKMKEENAELAGEMSGHLFFRDRYLGSSDANRHKAGNCGYNIPVRHSR